MKTSWMMPVVVVGLLVFSNSYGGQNCVNTPRQFAWGSGGSTILTLCGYQSGSVNTSYVQITNIPRKTKNACVTIQYEPTNDNHSTSDALTVAPNEGVILGNSRSPTTLSIDTTDGAQTATLPLETDGLHDDKYGFSVSGQSSSVDVNVKIDWDDRGLACGT